MLRYVIAFGSEHPRDEEQYYRYGPIDPEKNYNDIMDLVTNEFLKIGESINPQDYLKEYEKEILPHFDLDIYDYSGFNIFKMIIRLSGDAGSNNRTTIAYT